jgi:hypothetical protein
MAIKILTFHHEFVADLATDDKENHLRPFHIIQHPKITGAQFKIGKRIWPQALDRAGRDGRGMHEASLNRHFYNPLLTHRER